MKKPKSIKPREPRKKPRGLWFGLGVHFDDDPIPNPDETPYIIYGDEIINLNDDRLEKEDSEPGDPK